MDDTAESPPPPYQEEPTGPLTPPQPGSSDVSLPSSFAGFSFSSGYAQQQCPCGGPQSPAKRARHRGPRARIEPVGSAPNDSQDELDLVGVIITVCSGSSYDTLFSSIPQQGAPGTRTAVYSTNPAALLKIIDALEGVDAPADPVLARLVAEVRAVEPAAVAFNWECCSGCSDLGFGHDAPVTLRAAGYCIRHGHMAMFSDFSLKALIADWDPAVLGGPNPFVKFGEFGGSMELRFDPETLQSDQCPSAQLQTLGKLCAESGSGTVHALGSTIAYTIDPAIIAKSNLAYSIEVLTVAAELSGLAIPRDRLCYAGRHAGAAGHVVLRYQSGGILLASSAHWIELSKLGVSEEALIRVTTECYGDEAAAQLRSELCSAPTPEARSSTVQQRSATTIQMQSCAIYSPRRRFR